MSNKNGVVRGLNPDYVWAVSIAARNTPQAVVPGIPPLYRFEHAVLVIRANSEQHAHDAGIRHAEEVWLRFKGWEGHTAVVQRVGRGKIK